MARNNTAAIAERRHKVAELWLCGVSTADIAAKLQTPERTIWRDLTEIRGALQRERVADLDDNLTRSLAVLRRVQVSAWTTYAKAKPGSMAAVSALNAVLAAEQQITKLEGTTAPESVTVAAVAELKAALLATLADTDKTLARAFMRKLQERSAQLGMIAAPVPVVASTVTARSTP